MRPTRPSNRIWRLTHRQAKSSKEREGYAKYVGLCPVPVKSGGVRVIYFYVAAQAQARMLLIYRKGEKDNLTAAEKKILRKLNENW